MPRCQRQDLVVCYLMTALLVTFLVGIATTSHQATDSIASAAIRSLENRSSTIALETDETISNDEMDLMYLAMTQVSSIQIDSRSNFILRLHRLDSKTVQATLRLPDSKITLLGRFEWRKPRPSSKTPKTTQEKYPKVLQFKREKLHLKQVIYSKFTTRTLLVGGPYWRRDSRWHAGIFNGPRVEAHLSQDWGIYQGPVHQITELEFARIINDPKLVSTIQERLENHRFQWRLGFGIASSLSFISGGIILSSLVQDQSLSGNPLTARNRLSYQGLSGGLLATGLVTLIATILPPPAPSRVLDAHQAQKRCDHFNEELRKKLGLDPNDIP